MHFLLIAVGKVKEPYLRAGIAEYLKRLQAYGRVQVVEVREEPYRDPLTPAEVARVLAREGSRLLAALPARAACIVLDVAGEPLSSEELARRLADFGTAGRSEVAFVVGGSLGLDEAVKGRADLRLSLSRMTFPHQLVRLILLEQLYRALSILRGEPYHK